jgi:DeoR family transcriptional regulator of aga operon
LALHMRLLEGVSVVTNAVNIAAELVALPGVRVMLTGGILDHASFELVGQAVRLSLEGVRIHKFFVGTDGISLEHGVSNFSEAEALAARELARHADETIVLADSSKFKKSNLAQVATIDEIAAVVTTDLVPESVRCQFEAAGVRIVAAGYPQSR